MHDNVERWKCRYQHPKTPENTRQGQCRLCRNKSQRDYQRRQKERLQALEAELRRLKGEES